MIVIYLLLYVSGFPRASPASSGRCDQPRLCYGYGVSSMAYGAMGRSTARAHRCILCGLHWVVCISWYLGMYFFFVVGVWVFWQLKALDTSGTLKLCASQATPWPPADATRAGGMPAGLMYRSLRERQQATNT